MSRPGAPWGLLDRVPSPQRETLIGGTVVVLAGSTLGLGALAPDGLLRHLVATGIGVAVIGVWVKVARDNPAPPEVSERPGAGGALFVGPDAGMARLPWADRLAARDPSFSLPFLLASIRHLAGDGVRGTPLVEQVDLPNDGSLRVVAVVPAVPNAVRVVATGHRPDALRAESVTPCTVSLPGVEADPEVAAARRTLLLRESSFDADDFVSLAHRVSEALDAGDDEVCDAQGKEDLAWWRTRGLPAGGDDVTWLEARAEGNDDRIELRCGDRVLGLRRPTAHPEAAWTLWRLRSAVPWVLAAALVLLLLVPDDTWARVGGGQSFSRRSSSRSSSSSGGSGGGDLGLVLVLIQLVVDYPILGIPLILGVGGWFLYQRMVVYQGGSVVRRSHGAQRGAAPPTIRPRPVTIPGLEQIKVSDPGFSTTVLLDFAVLIHRRALEAVINRRWDVLAPFVAPGVAERLTKAHEGVTAIDEVVAGGARLLKIEGHGTDFQAFVRLETTRTEDRGTGPRRVHVEEILVFRRAGDAKSLPPDRVESLACPSCGAPIEVGPMGDCRQCGSAITHGQLQWQLVFVDRRFHKPAEEPQYGWTEGGDEPSVGVPVVLAPDLELQLRELKRRRPDLSLARFQERVKLTYFELQASWSEGRWERARPYVTDRMFQTLRFWMDRYKRAKLQNRLENVELHQLRVVKIDLDPWYESVSVRVWGSMKDSVVDAQGKVVGGNAKVARGFSEIWTFLRTPESAEKKTPGESQGCPSCGAPLDRVDETGICGYCDAKITSGRFDWVLARIDQPEAWGG